MTDPESLEFIKGKIAEFMPLFTSKQFNICADETFDLGKGKSREAAREKGVDRIYIDFVKAALRIPGGERQASHVLGRCHLRFS